jgi:acyl-coenzyme A thioesterase PaaI-like protein
MTLVERFAEAKRLGNPNAIVEAVPYSLFLGLSARLDGDELITTMRFSEHLIGNPALPALHGGTTGALLESAAAFELLWRAETVVLPKTITITIDYLRSAAPVDTHVRGVITRHGRRVANVHVEAWQGDRSQPIAAAHGIFLVMRDQVPGEASS